MAVSKAAHEAALRRERDRHDLERAGVRGARRIGRDARLAALRAFRTGDGDPAAAARQAMEPLTQQLADGMALAHMMGRRRSLLEVAPRFRARRHVKLANTIYDSALGFITRRMAISEAEALRMSDTYVRKAGDMSAQAIDAVDRKVQDALDTVARENLHTRAGVERLRQAFARAGVTPANSYALEDLYRTSMAMAYSAGRLNVLREPEIDRILWGFEYATVGDDRVRPNHVAMDGVRLPKDDPWWGTNFPPNGHSCRCTALEVFHGEDIARSDQVVRPELVEVDGQIAVPIADESFRFNPGDAFRDMMRSEVGA
jgi:SPP1 gp7 family putative phage head morphogenesis protein